MKIKTALFILLLGLHLPAFADDFDEAVKAYNSGDYATAAKLMRPLAEQGDADAQYWLGVMYRNGLRVLQDYVEAVKWFRRAAEQGHADAQNHLGVMYGIGQGIPQDDAIAYMWRNIAAASGDIYRIARDIVAADMTPAAIAEGQRLARECIASDYKNCP